MNQKPKLKLGDLIFVRESPRGVPPTIIEARVTKVGRKYFHFAPENGWERGPFLVENWRWADHNANFNRPVMIGLTREDIEKELRKQALIDEVSKIAQHHTNLRKLSLESLETIRTLLP